MEWNIQSRAHGCHECGKAFADRERLHTLLLTGAEGLDRLDVCAGCWQERYAEGVNHRRGFVSHWQTVHVVPAPPVEAIQRESAETLLRRLLERDSREDDPVCFVLAVMLERKRLFKMQGRSVRDGVRQLHYEHAKSGEIFTVVEADLRLDQLESVQARVSELLERGVPEEAPAEVAGFSGEQIEAAEDPVVAKAPGATETPDDPDPSGLPAEGEAGQEAR